MNDVEPPPNPSQLRGHFIMSLLLFWEQRVHPENDGIDHPFDAILQFMR